MTQEWAEQDRPRTRIDWSGASHEAAPVRETPAWAMSSAPPAEDLQEDDALGDLFAEDAPQDVAPTDDLDDLFADDAPAAEGTSWMDNPPDLDDLFQDTGATPDAPLDDLFADDAPQDVASAPVADDLDDLFADDAPAVKVAPVDDAAPLDDLFAEDEMVASQELASEAAAAEAAPVEEAPEEVEVPNILAAGWATPPQSVLKAGGLNATREAAEKRSQKKREAELNAAAAEVMDASEDLVHAVEEGASTNEVVTDVQEIVVPEDGTSEPVVVETIAAEAPKAEEVALVEVQAEETTAAAGEEAVTEEAVAEEVTPVVEPRRRESIEERRRRVEEASNGNLEWRQQAMVQESLAQTYALPDHLWTYVDRILGLISNDVSIQAVVNHFELTRDSILDAQQRRLLEEYVSPRLIDANVNMNNPLEIQTVFDMVYDELVGISVLGRLWRDRSITEVMVDGWDKITVEREGTIVRTPLRFRDLTHAQRVARDLAAKVSDRALTPANPLVTAQLPGARITFVYGGIVKGGISISLRKFVDLLGMEKLLSFGALTQEMALFLRECVLARATILVSGGTGTGKTTQINALSQFIPNSERVVTIEDAFELQLSNENVVSLQTKEKASADDNIVITQADLLVNTLRMRPDRVIVGEIREGTGALVMLRSASTGHDGTMTTIHANTPEAALNERLADLVREASGMPDEVAKRSVAGAIHLVVQVTRKRGRRYISEIAVVDRSCMEGGDIHPEAVFIGDLDADGVPFFSHVGGVRPDTELGQKLVETGFDLTHWER